MNIMGNPGVPMASLPRGVNQNLGFYQMGGAPSPSLSVLGYNPIQQMQQTRDNYIKSSTPQENPLTSIIPAMKKLSAPPTGSNNMPNQNPYNTWTSAPPSFQVGGSVTSGYAPISKGPKVNLSDRMVEGPNPNTLAFASDNVPAPHNIYAQQGQMGQQQMPPMMNQGMPMPYAFGGLPMFQTGGPPQGAFLQPGISNEQALLNEIARQQAMAQQAQQQPQQLPPLQAATPPPPHPAAPGYGSALAPAAPISFDFSQPAQLTAPAAAAPAATVKRSRQDRGNMNDFTDMALQVRNTRRIQHKEGMAEQNRQLQKQYEGARTYSVNDNSDWPQGWSVMNVLNHNNNVNRASEGYYSKKSHSDPTPPRVSNYAETSEYFSNQFSNAYKSENGGASPVADSADKGSATVPIPPTGKPYNETTAQLQQELLDLGYELPKYGVDGIMGPETKNAMISRDVDARALDRFYTQRERDAEDLERREYTRRMGENAIYGRGDPNVGLGYDVFGADPNIDFGFQEQFFPLTQYQPTNKELRQEKRRARKQAKKDARMAASEILQPGALPEVQLQESEPQDLLNGRSLGYIQNVIDRRQYGGPTVAPMLYQFGGPVMPFHNLI